MRQPDAATKRDKPWHIGPDCLDCGAPLEVAPTPDQISWDDEGNPISVPAPEDAEPWYDEWVCSAGCHEGIYMDWPDEFTDHLKAQMNDPDAWIPWEEVKRSIDE